MLKIHVKNHVLIRWPERVGGAVSIDMLEKMFRHNRYAVLEPGKKGRLIVSIKGLVFVISKSNAALIVHTVYGTEDAYKYKRDNVDTAYTQFEVDRWERHQYRRNVKYGKGV